MENSNNSQLLNFKIDRYDAATIDNKTLPKDADQFDSNLNETLTHFREVRLR